MIDGTLGSKFENGNMKNPLLFQVFMSVFEARVAQWKAVCTVKPRLASHYSGGEFANYAKLMNIN